MKIGRIIYEKEKYADLLRIGDEQDDMIARYLERGDMYVGFVNGRPVGVCGGARAHGGQESCGLSRMP